MSRQLEMDRMISEHHRKTIDQMKSEHQKAMAELNNMANNKVIIRKII